MKKIILNPERTNEAALIILAGILIVFALALGAVLVSGCVDQYQGFSDWLNNSTGG